MTKLLLTSVILLSFSAAFGQDYIVTIKSDTLKGEVKLLSYDLLDRVQFTEPGKKKAVYTATQLRRVFLKGDLYAPVKIDNAIRFMKVLISGYISLYAYRAPQQAGYDTRVLQKVGMNSFEVPNMGFKKFIGDLVEDCPVVYDKVKNGDLTRNSVEEIVIEYNTCIVSVQEQKIKEALPAPSTPAYDLVEKLKTKVNASDLSNKNDASDLLNSIGEKLRKGEAVPAYMKEGLKGYLGSREDLKGDMEQLLTLLNQ
ncbi:MAG: hypothetical protein WDO14_06060 [Bacteroidota bacterium]